MVGSQARRICVCCFRSLGLFAVSYWAGMCNACVSVVLENGRAVWCVLGLNGAPNALLSLPRPSSCLPRYTAPACRGALCLSVLGCRAGTGARRRCGIHHEGDSSANRDWSNPMPPPGASSRRLLSGHVSRCGTNNVSRVWEAVSVGRREHRLALSLPPPGPPPGLCPLRLGLEDRGMPTASHWAVAGLNRPPLHRGGASRMDSST